MGYKEYQVEQFLKDEYFIKWVIDPNPESDHFWKEWIRLNPEKRPVIETARQLVQSIQYDDRYRLSATRYHQVLENILEQNRFVKRKKHSGVLYPKWIEGLAASLIILLVAGIYYFNNKDATIHQAQPVQTITKITLAGQKKTIGLPDGSIIKLNSGSKLTYPLPFPVDHRSVELEGEAFFEVTKDVERPFVILSGKLKTKVLGTSFNVRSYEDENTISVSVLTGKVEIENEEGRSDILYPEDMGVYNKDDRGMIKTNFDSKSVFGWKDGLLMFKDMEISAIFSDLEKWYGVEIIVERGLKITGKYTGEYQNASLERILDGISYTSKFSYTINEDKVLITKQNK